MIQTIRIYSETATSGQSVLYNIQRALCIKGISQVRTVKIYRFEGVDQAEVERIVERLLTDIGQNYTIGNSPVSIGAEQTVEVGYKPGVMNPEVESISTAVRNMGITNLIAADSSVEYHFFGKISDKDMARILDGLLVNKTTQCVIDGCPKTLIISGTPSNAVTIPVGGMSNEQLLELSNRGQMFLNLEEMQVIQGHFLWLNRNPTDVELETLAQTWSEHCGHKTFNARLIVDGTEKPSLMSRLKKASAQYMENVGVVSAFFDNSGVLRFYDGYAISGKVETHNSPSAIEPYGGSATGSGGVFRDIMGTGKGGKIILSTDMFCLAPPDLPTNQVPPGCLHPNYLLRRVVEGVRDYGNRMGIPTANGSFTFHNDFRAKPSVIVGAYGIAPEELCHKGIPQPGDRIFVVGGKTGRDGIHGATFSSGEMTAATSTVNSTAVQIGNAIEEKRTADALLLARDRWFIRAITDCGAGGLSSAIGEMGAHTGVWAELSLVPLKYQGLAPWEIWVSESQERMVCAIAPENAKAFKQLCKNHNVEATDIGQFADNQTLLITYNGDIVCKLSMKFLHEGLPKRTLKASWKKPTGMHYPILPITDWEQTYLKVMAHLDVCSKEPVVRQYDHGVQGTSALPPFTGAPNDAVVLQPLPEKPYGMVVSHGLNPGLMSINPYHGAIWATTEALANLVAVGGNPQTAALIDNFIWPYPDEHNLGGLDRAMEGLVQAMKIFGLPCISGKDSLSSTYRYPNEDKLEIPPVLCISAFGRIPDVEKTVSADFKRAGSQIVFLGLLDIGGLAGSVYAQIQPNGQNDTYGFRIPQANPAYNPKTRFIRLHEQIVAGNILSCHDVSQGGVATTLAEMCFGGQVGAKVNLSRLMMEGQTSNRLDLLFFNETAGCFLLEVAEGVDVGAMFEGFYHSVIGITTTKKIIEAINAANDNLFIIELSELETAWQHQMKEVFG